MSRRHTSRVHRVSGFSLLELLAVMVVLSIAVPPMVSQVTELERASMRERQRTAALFLARSVLEMALSDARSKSDGLGFEVMSDSAYLSAPQTGLLARLAPLASSVTSLGGIYEIAVGAPFDLDSNVVPGSTIGALRLISVSVKYTDASPPGLVLSLSTLVVHP